MWLPAANTLVGRVARLPLRLVAREHPRRIVSGPLRGEWWIPAASSHSCWLGWYEETAQRLFSALAQPGAVVYDLGACVGFFSLLSARLTGAQGRVIAFEPLPRNLGYLRRHVELNQRNTIRIVSAAVGEVPGKARFSTTSSHSQNGIDADGDLEVDVVSLDEIAGEERPPNIMKIDVEGAEASVLRGARRTLATARPHILLSLHTAEARTECFELLREADYVCTSLYPAMTLERTPDVHAAPAN